MNVYLYYGYMQGGRLTKPLLAVAASPADAAAAMQDFLVKKGIQHTVPVAKVIQLDTNTSQVTFIMD